MYFSISVFFLLFFFFFNDTATTEIYTLSLHDALPIFGGGREGRRDPHHRGQHRWRYRGYHHRGRRRGCYRGKGGCCSAAPAETVPRRSTADEHFREAAEGSNHGTRVR